MKSLIPTSLVLLVSGSLAPTWSQAYGSVKAEQKVSDTHGGFAGTLHNADHFGFALTSLGDLDGDGICDLAAGAPDDDGGVLGTLPDRGAVWILLMRADGTVKAHQKINGTNGGFVGTLDNDDNFGWSVAGLGDLDGDGVADLAVGSPVAIGGGLSKGGLWILFLNADGSVKAQQKIGEGTGGFGGALYDVGLFAWSLAALGDLDGDGVPDLACGAFGDSDGGAARGAFWNLFLVGPDTQPPVISCPSAIEALDSKGGTPGTLVSFSVTVTDAIDPAPSLVCVPPSGSYFLRGTTIVTCTATDATGNQSVRTFPVYVHPSVRVR